MAKKKSALGRGLSSLIPDNNASGTSASRSKKSASANASVTNGNEILEITIDTIVANPHQPRTHFSSKELEDLLNSIETHGILQPLVVTRAGKEGYELVAGERRLRAARTLGLETVPAILRDATEQEKLELALIENIQRQDLNPAEEAVAYRALMEQFDLKQAEVAERVGKSRSAVANTLRLLDLDEHMLEALRDGAISKSHARTLLAEADPETREQLFQKMLSGDMSVREAESHVKSKRRRKKTTKKDPNILGHEKELREIFGTKVEIKQNGEQGRVSIEFYSNEELAHLIKRLRSLD